MNIRVIIADDHKIICDGLNALLDDEDDIEVVGEVHSGEELLKMADKVGVHIIIMDVAMPGLNGIEATRKLVEKHPKTHLQKKHCPVSPSTSRDSSN